MNLQEQQSLSLILDLKSVYTELEWRLPFGAVDFLTFEEAREFARSLNLKSWKEWSEYCKSDKKPKNIPTGAVQVYRDKGWEGYADFIGTNKNVGNWMKFENAREYVQELRLKNVREWEKFCKSGKRPKDIPSSPQFVYKDKGWTNWSDWLGTKNACVGNWTEFEEARKFVQSLNLRNRAEWFKYCKSDKKPKNIPSTPEKVYKEWINWEDWTGTQNIKWLSFEEARKFARSLNLKSMRKWKEFCKSNKRPDDIPSSPQSVYKDNGWISWSDWLGTKNIRENGWLSFEEARKFARSLGFKYSKEWIKYCRSIDRPENMPINPNTTYKNKGWISWSDWLGTDK